MLSTMSSSPYILSSMKQPNLDSPIHHGADVIPLIRALWKKSATVSERQITIKIDGCVVVGRVVQIEQDVWGWEVRTSDNLGSGDYAATEGAAVHAVESQMMTMLKTAKAGASGWREAKAV